MSAAVRVLRLFLIGSHATGDWRLRTRSLAGLGAGAGALLAGVGLMTTAGYLVSRAAGRPAIVDLTLVFVAVRFFGLARPALRYAERLASHDATLRLMRLVRRWFCQALLPLAPARLLAFRSGDLLGRLAGDVDLVQDAFLRFAAPLIVASLVGAAATVGLMWVDPVLAVVLLIVLVANGAVWPIVAERITRGKGRERNRERAALGAHLVTLLQGLDDVIAFGQESAQRASLRHDQDALDRLDRRFGLVSAIHVTMSGAFASLGVWAVLVVLAWRVDAGRVEGVWVAALTLAVLAAFEAVEGLPQAWQAREQINDAARRVFEVVDARPTVVEPAEPLARPGWIDCRAPAVCLDRVTFAYADRTVLHDVSLAIAPGEHVAIVGPSGSGKSTLVSLLVRFWDPDQGRITLDDDDLRRLRLADLRSSLALMPQRVHVFDETLRDNVRLGRPQASDEEIRRALGHARLGALLEALPRGLDTRLGEAGARLSAGERQRLGVARILLSDATLALIDEPTAHLDTTTERDVLRALRAWAHGRTLLLVSHRLSCVEDVDRLAVLDRGGIEAIGTHTELLACAGGYRSLWSAERQILDRSM